MSGTHQEGTQHEEADEIDNSKVATTSEFLPRFIIRLRVTALARQAGQHDLLPGFPRGTPRRTRWGKNRLKVSCQNREKVKKVWREQTKKALFKFLWGTI